MAIRTIDRRTLLRWAGTGVLAGAGASALSACAPPRRVATEPKPPPPAGERVELDFWTWLPCKPSVELWNRQNPDIQVRLRVITAGPEGGYQSMFSALEAGTGPDLAQVEYEQLPAFLLEQGLENLSLYDVEQYKDDFIDWQWEMCSSGGQVYAIPQASGPMAFYYRHDLFDEWGIDVPTTWDEYRDAARAVREAAPGVRMETFSPIGAQWMMALAHQAGAHWVRTDGDTWVLDMVDATTRKVLEFWAGMIEDDLVDLAPISTASWFKQLQTGDAPTLLGASWYDAIIKGNAPDTEGSWRVARMPQWEAGAKTSANWGGSATAVLRSCEYPREAAAFAHWLNTDPESIDLLVKAGYGWPAAVGGFDGSLLEEPDPFFDGQVYNEVFAEADRNIDTSQRFPPTTLQMYSNINDAVAAAVAEGTSLVGAYERAARLSGDDLRAKGLDVREA
ncbi:multiple sugar transport system substrate-binding protein [Murinocardiopsis flavida]|uniref:Multiple sugar transport system substrate-binding protein n=1 Tax=Murinocardiopsis flavida TaxID=645275 RepID=A0A2P8CZ11_9ACTN|nr:extracellular solute-binding protein [Murinocardiopsis flavida]PSK90193.1 multiple sugar transport system substrate-binding protein [Murinocardiopsis flavida]